MTLMTRRSALLTFTLIVVAMSLAVAAYAYIAMVEAADSPDRTKLLSERVLYVAIVTASLAIVSGLALVIRSRNLTHLLDKLVAMNHLSGFPADAAIRRLGDVGERIHTIYRQVSDLSEKKSLKISALTALNELLLEVTGEMILVVDSSGTVLQAGKPLLDRLELPRTEVFGQLVDDLIPGADISGAIDEAAQTRSPVVRDRKGDSVVLNPVINRDGDVAYLVAVLTRSVTEDMKKTAVAVKPLQTKRPDPGFIRRLIRRGRKER